MSSVGCVPNFNALGLRNPSSEWKWKKKNYSRPAPHACHGRFPVPERVCAVRDYLLQATTPAPEQTIARAFTGARLREITAILERGLFAG